MQRWVALAAATVLVQAQVPSWPQTWQMNSSTILMVCNNTGFTDPQSTKGWSIIDFDWSNAKAQWAAAQPMNCEELLIEQVNMTAAASPGTSMFIYRNAVKVHSRRPLSAPGGLALALIPPVHPQPPPSPRTGSPVVHLDSREARGPRVRTLVPQLFWPGWLPRPHVRRQLLPSALLTPVSRPGEESRRRRRPHTESPDQPT